MPPRIVIVDYGMGNLHSVFKMLSRLDCSATVSSNPQALETADKVILPGVGHFGNAMSNLRQRGLLEPLNDFVNLRQGPLLGICLGMQLMAKSSDEGSSTGLGWIDARVVRLAPRDRLLFKVPHYGWNSVSIVKPTPLMSGLPPNPEFYFAHSYHMEVADKVDILNETIYEQPFVSAIQKRNLIGVQYHPEKSHEAGERLLSNFVEV